MPTQKSLLTLHKLCTLVLLVFSLNVAGQSFETINQKDSLFLSSRLYSNSNVDQVVDEVVSSFKTQEFRPSVISIGEATHGTEEIKNLQFKCSEKIVKSLGFKSITLAEYPFLDSYNMLKCVLLGEIEIDEIVKGQHYDIRELLFWLKEYNSSLDFAQKVWIISSDRSNYLDIISSIDTILSNNNIGEILLSEEYRQIKEVIPNNKKDIDLENLFTTVEKKVNLYFSSQRRSPNSEVDLYFLNMAFKNLKIELETMDKSDEENYYLRDSVMFQNIVSIVEKKQETMIIRGHNSHINKVTLDKELFGTKKTLGVFLREAYKSEYFSIGTIIQKGTYYTGVTAFEAGIEERVDKIGNVVGKLTQEMFAFLTVDSSIREVLNSYPFVITTGTAKSQLTNAQGIGDAFDGLLLIKQSTPFKFFDDADFFTLFLNLGDKEAQKLLKKASSNLDISYNYRLLSGNLKSKVCLSLYFHDSNEKLLGKHYACSTKEGPIKERIQIPINSNIISISLVVSDSNSVSFSDFSINQKKYKQFDLYDWQKKGYKLITKRNTITVIK